MISFATFFPSSLQNGEIDCWPIECPPTFCSHPILRPGHCCPTCDYEGTEHDWIETWLPNFVEFFRAVTVKHNLVGITFVFIVVTFKDITLKGWFSAFTGLSKPYDLVKVKCNLMHFVIFQCKLCASHAQVNTSNEKVIWT